MKKWIALSATIVLALAITVSLQKAKARTAPAGKPDLIVDQKRLLQNWVVRVEKLPASFETLDSLTLSSGLKRWSP